VCSPHRRSLMVVGLLQCNCGARGGEDSGGTSGLLPYEDKFDWAGYAGGALGGCLMLQ
jgi:hypothetical protein